MFQIPTVCPSCSCCLRSSSPRGPSGFATVPSGDSAQAKGRGRNNRNKIYTLKTYLIFRLEIANKTKWKQPLKQPLLVHVVTAPTTLSPSLAQRSPSGGPMYYAIAPSGDPAQAKRKRQITFEINNLYKLRSNTHVIYGKNCIYVSN